MSSRKDIPKTYRLPQAELKVAYSGITPFRTTRWTHQCNSHWVLDRIDHGQQTQRIGRGKPFTRLSGLVAFYAPRCAYHERQNAGETVHESFMVFSAGGDLAAKLHQLVGKRRWCHILDPEQVIGTRLRHLGHLVFHRRPGFELLAHAAMLELLGLLLTSSKVEPTTREMRSETPGRKRDLVQTVEGFIRSHLSEPLRVEDLASHLKMSLPTLARTYPLLAGETPACTIRRLKIEAAKRLLLANELSVKECALQLGFSSEFHLEK